MDYLKIYDEIPYEDEPFVSTHPQTLSSIATLYGLNPARPENCRLLELGAANGNNILGMAYAYPNSSFVGIDLSRDQVAKGQLRIDKLGINNIELIHSDIRELSPSLGTFDFIIAHGVLSWVPKDVRNKIFELCNSLLNPDGICYLSYNTYPGWKAREVFREIMLLEGNGSNDTHEQVSNARIGLGLTANMILENGDDFSKHLQAEIVNFQNRPDWYFVHDFIAPNNQPFYISDIFKMAEEHGLQYLADTELSMNSLHGINTKAQETLKRLTSDRLRFEQYSDIARIRSFRRTLLCKKDRPVLLNQFRNTLPKLFLAANLQVKALADDHPGSCNFSHPNGGSMRVTSPFLKKCLTQISQSWPAAIPVSELITSASDENESKSLIEILLSGVFANILEPRSSIGPASAHIPERPISSKFAREQALESNIVTSLLHHNIALSDLEQAVLLLLDGENSLEDAILKLSNSPSQISLDTEEYKVVLLKLADYGLLKA